MVLEGGAGEEGAKGAALDGPFGLKTGGEGVVVGASVNDNCGFAAVGKVDGTPGVGLLLRAKMGVKDAF